MDFPIGHNSMNQEPWDPSSLVHSQRLISGMKEQPNCLYGWPSTSMKEQPYCQHEGIAILVDMGGPGPIMLIDEFSFYIMFDSAFRISLAF